MKLTLREIAEQIDGDLVGDGDREICGVSSFDDASTGEITFASDVNFLKRIGDTRASAVIVPLDFEPAPYDGSGNSSGENVSGSSAASAGEKGLPEDVNIIKVSNPKRKFFRILTLFHPAKKPSCTVAYGSVTGENFVSGSDLTLGSHVTIGDNVSIGQRVHIMHGVFIGDDVVIGDDTVIKPNVTVMERTKIGSRVIIHSGTVIGSDGFGFTQEVMDDDPSEGQVSHGSEGEKKIPRSGRHEKIPHAGFVHIDDDVEIGACNTIDRGTFGGTWIKRGVKTDNLVHIAHNVTIGEHSLIVAQVGIAGSTKIGKRVILAGKAGISGHISIGDGAIIGPGAGIISDVKPGHIVSGIPGIPHKLWLKVSSILPKLPEMRKKLISIERKLDK